MKSINEDEADPEIASPTLLFNLSRRAASRMFANEPGVLALKGSDGRVCTIRVPQSVLERVRERSTIKAKPAALTIASSPRRRPQRELRRSPVPQQRPQRELRAS
jgi:hypothetical protein